MKQFFLLLALAFIAPCVPLMAQDNWETINKNSLTAFNAKDYATAFTLTQQALAQAAKEFGAESAKYAMSSHNMGYMYLVQQNFKEAEKHYLKAIEIRRKLNLETDLAFSIGQYATLLQNNLKDFANAEKYWLQAKELNKKIYTEKSSQYYNTAVALGKLYNDAGRVADAEPYYLYQVEHTKLQKGAKSEDYAIALKELMTLYNKNADKTKYAATYGELLSVMAALGYDNNQNYFEGMFSLATYYEEQQEAAKAATTYLALLPAIKKTLGDTSALYIAPMMKLLGLYGGAKDYKNMSVLAYDLVDILKRKPGERGSYLVSLEGAAAVFQLTGDYYRAEGVLTDLAEALKQDKNKPGNDYVGTLRKLGDVQLKLGKHKEAELTFRESLRNNPQKNIDYAGDLSKIGFVTALVGKLSAAERLYEEARQLFVALKQEYTNEYAVTLNYLGNLYAATGRAEIGLTLLQQARSIYAKTVGTMHPNYAVGLSGMASIYMNQGNYNAAEQLLLEANAIQAKNVGKQHPEYAFSLVRLAMFYKQIGNTIKWESNLLEALAIQNAVLPADHPSLMTTANNLAVFYNNTLQYAKAEPFYLRSLEISRKSLGERLDYLNTLTNLAGLYVNLKNFTKAEENYTKAQQLAKKLYGEGLEYANVLQGMAAMHDFKGDYQKAEPYFLQASGIKKKLQPPGNPAQMQLNIAIGKMYQAMGNFVKAEPFYAAAREQMLQQIDKNFAFLSEAEKQEYLLQMNYRFELFQNFYLAQQKQRPAAANDAFNAELATKGLTLNAAIEMRKAIEAGKDTTSLRLYNEWLKTRAEIAKLSTADAIPAAYTELEVKAENLEKELTRVSAAFSEGRVLSRVRMDAVKAKLKDNEVAIEFAAFKKFDGVNWTDSTIYVAIVLRKNDVNARIVKLCNAAQLDALIKIKAGDDKNFVSNLYAVRGIGVEVNNSLASGKQLYELIWKPIDNLLKSGDKIYFSPAGMLHQIAFSAIPYEQKLLSDQYNLVQLSSTAMLLKDNHSTTPLTNITLFGGIDYDVNKPQQAAATSTRGAAWEYLPGTLTEVEKIAKMAGEAKYSATTYLGEKGTEDVIKNLGNNNKPDVIHIASHGFFYPDPQLNYQADEATGNLYSNASNPMNRAGMLFAGANATWTGTPPSAGEDGVLTAYEASNLSLSGTQLVVLSACETGLGDIKGNEGVFGLQRSFKMAGVQYLMMSLWKVPDAETAEFMQHFYTALFSGKEIEESFAGAQTSMKKKYPKDPYKWAAFVLVR